jgi:hypothetical protein
VNTTQVGQGHLKVELLSPSTAKIPCRCHIQELSPQEYRLSYTPDDPGRYQLRILFNNQLVQGKSFDVNVIAKSSSTSSTPSVLVRIERIQPIDIPIVGDNICLQSIS